MICSFLMPGVFFCLSSVQSFDLAKHLNTAPELVDRVYNRPTLETLEKKSIQGAVHPRSLMVCVSMHLDQLHLLCEELGDCSKTPQVTFHCGKVDLLCHSETYLKLLKIKIYQKYLKKKIDIDRYYRTT